MYDPAFARFISVDPLAEDFPELITYQYASYTPIQAIDLDGLEAYFIPGTNGDPEDFEKKKRSGQLIEEIEQLFGHNNDLTIDEKVVPWSGSNNTNARETAVADLIDHVQSTREDGEPITILGHSHGGNVALEAAKLLASNPVFDGIERNIVTLNTPSVKGGTQLLEEANKRVNHFHVFATNDIVVPNGGFNKSGGPLYSGGEKENLIG